jgi:hypothetical protein
MNSSTHRDAPRQADHVQEHCGTPSVDTVPHEPCFYEPALRPNTLGRSGPDEATFESFAGGAGI